MSAADKVKARLAERATAKSTAAAARKPAAPMPESVTVANVAAREVEWLWRGRIPLRKLTLFDGNPNAGKSLITVDWCGRVTRGAPFYGCATSTIPPSAVLIISDEDEVADTYRPRLEAADVDLTLVDIVPMARDVESIARHVRWRAAQGTPIRLIIIDPLALFLGLIDANDARGVRAALKLLHVLAAEHDLAIVLIRHFSKRTEGPALHRGAGSIVIMALARSGLLVAPDPSDKDACVLSMVKYNLTKKPASLRYRIREDEAGRPRVEWIGASEHDADELVTPPSSRNGKAPTSRSSEADRRRTLDRAIVWLTKRLERGPAPRADIMLDAHRAGMSESTIDRARRHLPSLTTVSRSKTDDGKWTPAMWAISGDPPSVKDGAARESLTDGDGRSSERSRTDG